MDFSRLPSKERIMIKNLLQHIHNKFRLLFWRILDYIDRKLGPGPGDHR